MRFRSACIWQLWMTISVESAGATDPGDGAGTVTQSNSPRACSCANRGRLRTYTFTLPPPGGDGGREAAAGAVPVGAEDACSARAARRLRQR